MKKYNEVNRYAEPSGKGGGRQGAPRLSLRSMVRGLERKGMWPVQGGGSRRGWVGICMVPSGSGGGGDRCIKYTSCLEIGVGSYCECDVFWITKRPMPTNKTELWSPNGALDGSRAERRTGFVFCFGRMKNWMDRQGGELSSEG